MIMRIINACLQEKDGHSFSVVKDVSSLRSTSRPSEILAVAESSPLKKARSIYYNKVTINLYFETLKLCCYIHYFKLMFISL